MLKKLTSKINTHTTTTGYLVQQLAIAALAIILASILGNR